MRKVARKSTPAKREAKASPEVVLPPVADRGAMNRAVAPLLEGKSAHPETVARIVEQTSKYAEHAVRQALKESGA